MYLAMEALKEHHVCSKWATASFTIGRGLFFSPCPDPKGFFVHYSKLENEPSTLHHCLQAEALSLGPVLTFNRKGLLPNLPFFLSFSVCALLKAPTTHGSRSEKRKRNFHFPIGFFTRSPFLYLSSLYSTGTLYHRLINDFNFSPCFLPSFSSHAVDPFLSQSCFFLLLFLLSPSFVLPPTPPKEEI